MTTSLLPQPVARFFDASGNPLAGGKVWTYEAGTLTPKASFTDSTGATANTNPVILDSSGSADIWLDGNYKINLLDANDVQQANYPVDNVTSLTVGNNFYTTTGAGNAYVLTPSPALTLYTNGDRFYINPNFNNTGPATINVSALGAKNLTKNGSTALASGDLIAGRIYEIVYDGTQFQVTSGVNSLTLTGDVTGSGTGTIATTIAGLALSKLAPQGANTVLANATALPAVPTAVSLSASTVLGRDASGNIAALTLGGGLTATSGVLSQAGRVRIASTTYTTNTTLSTTIPADDTIPQNTEGNEILTLAFTPVNASSTLRIEWIIFGASTSGGGLQTAALFVDSTANALDVGYRFFSTSGAGDSISGLFTTSAGSTSARTYRIRVGPAAGSFFPNGTAGATRLFGGVSACKLIVTEILP